MLFRSTSVTANDTLASDQARARVTLHDGRVLSAIVEHATGSSARPMSDGELDAKFSQLAARVLRDDATARLLDVCRTMAGRDDAAEATRLGTTGLIDAAA